jgi:hypothetical protein
MTRKVSRAAMAHRLEQLRAAPRPMDILNMTVPQAVAACRAAIPDAEIQDIVDRGAAGRRCSPGMTRKFNARGVSKRRIWARAAFQLGEPSDRCRETCRPQLPAL